MGEVVVDWWEAAFDFESESAWGDCRSSVRYADRARGSDSFSFTVSWHARLIRQGSEEWTPLEGKLRK